jgi:phosphoribosylformylglycinamidine cyclo-ligase
LGLALDSSTWKLPAVFDWLQREGNVPRMEMWRTFNCGIGYTLIAGRDDAAPLIAELRLKKLEARVIGEVVSAGGTERVSIA